MGSSLGSYEIARSGMYVSERGLFVTGHNISNVNTPGFSRQQSIAKTSHYIGNNSNMQYGLGASVEQTRQIRNTYLDNVYRKENKELGKWDTINKTYLEIQNIIGEPLTEGLQQSLNQYWDAWQQLSKEPESLTVRALVRQRGQALSDYVNHMGFQFNSLHKNLDNQLVVRVKEVNDISTKIAALNEQITGVESSNDRANDLRDSRNSLLDRLSSLMNIEVSEHVNGSVDVVSGGYSIINGKQTMNILADDPTNLQAFHEPYLEHKVNGKYVKFSPLSGEINGILESRDRIEKHIVDSTGTLVDKTGIVPTLNKLIDALVSEVNTIHLGGANIAPPTVTFFEYDNIQDYGIKNINVNNEINKDLNKITTGLGTSPAQKGDNRATLQIANLRHNALTALGNTSMDEFYQQKVVLDLGTKAQETDTMVNSQALLVQSIDNQRNAISNVSMDEEMSTMLKYQFAYSGASKAFNTIDEMINTIINRMGLVGR